MWNDEYCRRDAKQSAELQQTRLCFLMTQVEPQSNIRLLISEMMRKFVRLVVKELLLELFGFLSQCQILQKWETVGEIFHLRKGSIHAGPDVNESRIAH